MAGVVVGAVGVGAVRFDKICDRVVIDVDDNHGETIVSRIMRQWQR